MRGRRAHRTGDHQAPHPEAEEGEACKAFDYRIRRPGGAPKFMKLWKIHHDMMQNSRNNWRFAFWCLFLVWLATLAIFYVWAHG